jgi:hypothetical protein
MSENQLKYLTKVHMPLFASKGVCQMHFDIMLSYLRQAMEQSGAEASQLNQVERKLKPLRDVFPPTSHARVVVQSDSSNKAEKDKATAAVAAVLAKPPAKQPPADAVEVPDRVAKQQPQKLQKPSVTAPAAEQGGCKGGVGKWLRAMVCGSSPVMAKE